MAKRKTRKSKTIWHYFKIYFLSIFVSAIIIAIGSFFTPRFDCANSKSCKSDLVARVDNDVVAIFQGRKIVPPKVDLAMLKENISVLGARTPNDKKHIYIDLSTQTLYAFEGADKYMQVLISSGKWGRTPVGNFNIWQKLPVTRMTGGQGADFYDLPNIRFVMYFHNDFGLHEAYWHDNFGHPMSHGCVNMRYIDVEKLYQWADGPAEGKLGTAVSVCSQFTEPNKCLQS